MQSFLINGNWMLGHFQPVKQSSILFEMVTVELLKNHIFSPQAEATKAITIIDIGGPQSQDDKFQ